MPASEHGDFFVTMGAHAVKGYGPLLYDKAIEVASSLGCKLINHATEFYLTHKDKTRKMTSPEAFKVWNKYKERKDVKSHDLGDGYFALSKEPNQKYFYE